MRHDLHTPPVRADIEQNKAKEPEGERIRSALERFLRRNKIAGMLLDTEKHMVQIESAPHLPPRMKSVLTIWGSIYVCDERRPRMRRVVRYFNKEDRPWIEMECGHTKPLPAGVYDESTKRLCRECAK